MATKKKNSSRKALAVALGVMGVAGLSLASAAQLTVNTDDEVAMGVGVFAPCDADATVGIEYDYNASYLIDEVSITGLDDDCVGNSIEFTIENLTNADITGSSAAIVFSATAVDDNTWTFAIGTPSVSIEDDLNDATVVIN